jgi:hypothetical protein
MHQTQESDTRWWGSKTGDYQLRHQRKKNYKSNLPRRKQLTQTVGQPTQETDQNAAEGEFSPGEPEGDFAEEEERASEKPPHNNIRPHRRNSFFTPVAGFNPEG